MKKLGLLFSTLLSLPLMMGCGSKNIDTDNPNKRPYDIFESDLFKAASVYYYGDKVDLKPRIPLRKWYDTHDFAMYGTSPTFGLHYDPENPDPYTSIGGGEVVIIHSAKHNYTYRGFHRSQFTELRGYKDHDPVPYFEQILQKNPNNNEAKSYYFKDGLQREDIELSEDMCFDSFLYAICVFMRMDPNYEERYKEYYSEYYDFNDYADIISLQYDGRGPLYCYFDYDVPDGTQFISEAGKIFTYDKEKSATGRSYKYKRNDDKTIVEFELNNAQHAFYLNSPIIFPNVTKLSYEFEGTLPYSFTWHVSYNEDHSKFFTDGYDVDIKFSYDELPSDPFSLVGKDFSYKDETHLLEWTEKK